VPEQPPANDSDRERFRVLREGNDELHVGHALRGRSVHHFFFPVARAIHGSDGAFIGAAQVGVEVTYIANLFGSLDVGPNAHLGLYRTRDGMVVARYPMMEGLLNETVATSPYFLALAGWTAQSWTGWTSHSGRDDLVGARRLGTWPLIVSVSLPRSEVYASAWSRLLWRSIAAALIIAMLAALTAVAARQARREASLVRELEHRVKNMLAVVTALVDRARDDTQSHQAFMASLRGRIDSMARSQTLLSQSRWRGVNFADLVQAELAPYATGTNTHLEGPPVYLAPEATHGMAMVVHELTTNAAKYGALSRPGGRVSVRWAVSPDHSPGTVLKVQWNETGGPQLAAAPTREGYGSGVIRDLLPYELGGRVDLGFAPEGVHCTIELPMRA
jgi:two-component sensor histidine kinase